MIQKLRTTLWAALLFLCAFTAFAAKPQPDQTSRLPNILWISLEDITPMMGCYGDNVGSALQAATKDESVSVRITAAEGLFNLGRYEDGLPAIISALGHPVPAARIRAACVLDTQPPEANEKLQPAIEALRRAASEAKVKGLPGIPYGLNQPFERAIKAITGEETYYRW